MASPGQGQSTALTETLVSPSSFVTLQSAFPGMYSYFPHVFEVCCSQSRMGIGRSVWCTVITDRRPTAFTMTFPQYKQSNVWRQIFIRCIDFIPLHEFHNYSSSEWSTTQLHSSITWSVIYPSSPLSFPSLSPFFPLSLSIVLWW